MRPDLPWNVAGIPSEAREAARAAARREGMAVGEWLTRRILRSFADAGDEDELTRDTWTASKMYRQDEPAPAPRRDTDEMFERVSRSEAETNDVYRRIEEQMRGVARRLDSTERSQTENNRAITKAATEINIAAREQAQAFDQLSAHVVALADRLERVEHADHTGNLKDAVKALHTGLSRLADQIAQNANQSATQTASLANSLEAVASKLAQVRDDAENSAHATQLGVAALDNRLYLAEKAAQTGLGHLEQRIHSLDDRAQLAEKAAQANANALERALDTFLSRQDLQDEFDRHDARTQAVVARVEEAIAKVPAPDTTQADRLAEVERNLAQIATRLDSLDPANARLVEDALKKLTLRVEGTENRQRDSVVEFRNALADTAARLTTIESKPEPVVAPAPSAAPQPVTPPLIFDAPPFAEMPKTAPPPFPATDVFAPASAAFDPAAAFPADVAPDAEGFGSTSNVDSYLLNARRSAREAANEVEAEEPAPAFNWGNAAAVASQTPARTRYMILGFIVLIAVALIAGLVLSQNFAKAPAHPTNVAVITPAPQAGTPLHALPPQNDDDTLSGTSDHLHRSALPPLEKKIVAAAPIHAVPAPVTAPKIAPVQAASMPALDRLTAAANAGNSKAELIVGLKYLNGDGVAANEVQAAKWLEKAANAGEPVAEYRLGTLYEKGKGGVAADPVKATHWYQAAAMQGNRKAMHNLAVAFAEGTGTKKDMSEAARWFSKASSLGLADSQFNLAVLYERGLGVPQSLLDAYKWYAVAAASGDTESKARIDALTTQLSADDRAAAQKAADSFKPGAIDPRANVPPQMPDLPQG